MNSELWKKVKGILEEVLELPAAARSEYSAKACGGDEDLRRQVESLLEFDDGRADLLEPSAFDSVFEKDRDLALGSRIDKYKIIDKLGAGGMGVVYLAERAGGEFNQKVALKLIKRGMDSDAILRRFLNERQILVSLEHPNIARLIDGGTTADGLPFFVMECVEGVSVDEYCKTGNLSQKDILVLFRKICEAVAFAHQKLVVHRDLKPSNILVTKDGAPKLLDFGIAKLLNSTDSAATQTNQRVLTPAYASPEQLRGEAVDTSGDVYSLGKILCELLQAENPETKTSRQHLNTDVRNILKMAVHEESSRRYGSVEKFSEDLRRYLAGLPVTARKDTFSYRATNIRSSPPLRRSRHGFVHFDAFRRIIRNPLAVARSRTRARNRRARASACRTPLR